MSDETLPQPRQKSLEYIAVTQIVSENTGVESDVAKAEVKAENETDLLNVSSKQDNKEGKGLHLRLSKLLARNRCGNKQPEEISIDSSKTADTRSSFSNESRIDYSKQVGSSSSSILPRIGSQLKKLMKFKSQREMKKTEKDVIVLPDDDAAAAAASPPTPENSFDLEKEEITENAISENVVVVSENSAITDIITNEEESILSMQSDTENNPAIIIAENPNAVLITAAGLNAQLGAPQAEVQIQTSRRNPREIVQRTPYLYLQEEEPRVESYVQNMFGGERESIATGSESSTNLSEVVDANEQPEGHDVAEQYYNAVLRAVIRRQFRHLDDEPPIY